MIFRRFLPRSLALSLDAGLCLFPAFVLAAPEARTLSPQESELTIPSFTFATGETRNNLKLHYALIGKPQHAPDGSVTNAVILFHGTGASGKAFLQDSFARELFAEGAPLDPARYFIILPDALGHGGSSKPSDGERTRFPAYTYKDMTTLNHKLLEALGVKRARLAAGFSMGCMLTFSLETQYPGSSAALLPVGCGVGPMGGLNRMWRKAAMEAITSDPAWRGGDYTDQPTEGVRRASAWMTVMSGGADDLQRRFPDSASADAELRRRTQAATKTDANDLLYALNASRFYNVAPRLKRLKIPIIWITAEDDLINPPSALRPDAVKAKAPSVTHLVLPAKGGHAGMLSGKLWKDPIHKLLEE